MIVFILLILVFGVGCFCFGLMIGVHYVARGASQAFRAAENVAAREHKERIDQFLS